MENHFSERERQVITFLLQGKSNKEIALGLGITNRTVEFHLSNIYSKLEVNSRIEAALKLSEGNLRESTGVEDKGDLRNSTVERRDDLKENLDRPIPLWRRNMKNILVFTLTGTFLLAMIFVGLSASKKNGAPEATFVPVGAEQPQPTTVITLASLTPPTELQYEVLSPTQIRKDNIIFEVIATIMPSFLQVDVVGRFPADSPCAPAEFPVITSAPCYLPTVASKVEISFPSAESSLELEPYYGGGGGGGGGDQSQGFYTGTGFVYQLITPITVGQRIQFSVIVTFNESFGINQPVPFELDLTVISDE